MNWDAIQKPAELAETRVLEAILSGQFPINGVLPGERELAAQIGVTRPTLREALQRLSRDGWLEIQHGKATRVRDYWTEGGLTVLSILAQSGNNLAPDFVTHLLEFRILMAPAYTRQAFENAADEIGQFLEGLINLESDPESFARSDWDLHILLTRHATNPIFRFLANGFQPLSLPIGKLYFSYAACRSHSLKFYNDLLNCARSGAAFDAQNLCSRVMEESLALWIELLGHKQLQEDQTKWNG
jgi:GntR family negative regulator for fad regulon and positive regulator of fabA